MPIRPNIRDIFEQLRRPPEIRIQDLELDNAFSSMIDEDETIPEVKCKHVLFQYSKDIINFRDKRYMLGAMCTEKQCLSRLYSFDWNGGDRTVRRQLAKQYDFDGYKINIARSDYGVSKLYVRSNTLTLYIPVSQKFLEDEKTQFLFEEKYLKAVINGIHLFNYNQCNECNNICGNKVVNPEPQFVSSLEELFEV